MAQSSFQNIDLFNPGLAGRLNYAFENPYTFEDVLKTESTKSTAKDKLANALGGFLPQGVDLESFKELPENIQNNMLMLGYLEKQNDPDILRRRRREEIEDLDDLQAKQMARAQKYGKESIFYDFMYRGLPNMQRQKAFSKYAFADIMPQIVSNAYARIDGSTAVNTPYMSINPMGGIR